MSFTSNKETKKYNNIRKTKYSTTKIKYYMGKKNCSKKSIENSDARLNFERRTYQNINFFFVSE